MRFSSIGPASLMLASAACSYVATPRIEDAPALHDYAREASAKQSECARHVDVYEASRVDESVYKTVGTISATCYPGARAVCERSLRQRACELGADLVVIVPSAVSPVPVGASRQSLSSITGRALRLKDSRGGSADAGG